MTFLCPICGTELEKGPNERYVTVCEHVSLCENNPEWDPGLRTTYHCPSTDCWMHNNGFWDYMGNGRYGDNVLMTGFPWCYNGFYFDAVDTESDMDRPHTIPDKPLTRQTFCKVDKCPYEHKCYIRTVDEKIDDYKLISTIDLKEHELGKEIIRYYLCIHYDADAVKEYFKPWDGIEWHRKCEKCGSHYVKYITKKEFGEKDIMEKNVCIGERCRDCKHEEIW